MGSRGRVGHVRCAYLARARTEPGKVVRYGKNITDITQEQSIEDTYTGIYPYYSSDGDYVDLSEKVLLAPTAALYPYPRIMPVDFTPSFASTPDEAALRAKAEEYLAASSIGLPRVSIDVSYVDDTDISIPIYLCDTVKVIFEPLGISTMARYPACPGMYCWIATSRPRSAWNLRT